jgi:hypothetical protein
MLSLPLRNLMIRCLHVMAAAAWVAFAICNYVQMQQARAITDGHRLMLQSYEKPDFGCPVKGGLYRKMGDVKVRIC